mgnify:CR=1 FL=1
MNMVLLDSPDGEVEGVKVGDIVDYMTYGYLPESES